MSDRNVDLTGTKLAECVAKVIPIVNHLYDYRHHDHLSETGRTDRAPRCLRVPASNWPRVVCRTRT
jgi:hypothetical protein